MTDVNDDKLEALTDQTISVILGGKEYKLRRMKLGDISNMNVYKKRLIPKEDTLEYDIESLGFAHLFCRLMIPTNQISPEEFLMSIDAGDYKKLSNVLSEMGLETPSQK